MADTDLRADSAHSNPTSSADVRRFLRADEPHQTGAEAREKRYVPSPFRQAYRYYRYTKAVWDAAIYLPERNGADVPDEINDPLMNAQSEATIALMTTPARSLSDLRQKLEVYRDEGLEQWGESNKLTGALIADVERLMKGAGDV